jgi:hypothetical protein
MISWREANCRLRPSVKFGRIACGIGHAAVDAIDLAEQSHRLRRRRNIWLAACTLRP